MWANHTIWISLVLKNDADNKKRPRFSGVANEYDVDSSLVLLSTLKIVPSDSSCTYSTVEMTVSRKSIRIIKVPKTMNCHYKLEKDPEIISWKVIPQYELPFKKHPPLRLLGSFFFRISSFVCWSKFWQATNLNILSSCNLLHPDLRETGYHWNHWQLLQCLHGSWPISFNFISVPGTP